MSEAVTPSSPQRSLGRSLLALLLAVNVYLLSFFLVTDPCKRINLAPVVKGERYEPFEGSLLPPHPGITALCASENQTLNSIAYYIYWPSHKFLQWRHLFVFVKDPSQEIW